MPSLFSELSSCLSTRLYNYDCNIFVCVAFEEFTFYACFMVPKYQRQYKKMALPLERGSPLCKLLGAEEIGLFLLADSYWGYLISHWLAILLIIVGFPTKPNTETEVCQWIMIWCWFLLTKIDKTYIVQDRWGLLADEKRESLGAVNCDTLTSIFLEGEIIYLSLENEI